MPMLFYLPLIVWIGLFEVAQDEMRILSKARLSTMTGHQTLSDKRDPLAALSPRAGFIRSSSFFQPTGVVQCLFCRDVPLPRLRHSVACLPRPASQCRVTRPGTTAMSCGRCATEDWSSSSVMARPFPDQADTDPLNFDNIAAQRNLNDKGRTLAKTFGDAVRQAGVPVGKVFTSKYNRAYETAVIAGFKDIEKTADITEGGLVVSPNENSRRIDALRRLLATAPMPGTNTILITHKPNIVDALGKDWFDVKEGEASIFRPENGSYKLIARVQMEEWPSPRRGSEVTHRNPDAMVAMSALRPKADISQLSFVQLSWCD